MRDILGILVSFVFIFSLLGFVQILIHRNQIDGDTGRKIVHIGVAHWWIIAMLFHHKPWVAAIGPLFFIAFNLFALKRPLFSALDSEAARASLGTIYYPVSLLVLVFLTFGGVFPVYTGALGVLIMGWGDGMAALIGRRSSRLRFTVFGFGTFKSVRGTVAMFLASLLVSIGVLSVFSFAGGIDSIILTSVKVAATATAIEVLTPFGLDNLTVPILTTVLFNLARV